MLQSAVSYARSLRRAYRFWKERRSTGEYELLLLPSLVDRSKAAIDVGGNVGSYCYQLSKLAAQVVVFEPNPVFARQIRALKLRNTTVEEVALSDHAGTAELIFPMVEGGFEDMGMATIDQTIFSGKQISRTVNVRITRLDDYRFSNVGFLKIDVEGHEEGVLAGAAETIARCSPNILVEIEEKNNPGGIARIGSSLQSLGYSGHFYENGSRRPLAEFNLERHQPSDLVWDKKRHVRRTFPLVNNFIFTR